MYCLWIPIGHGYKMSGNTGGGICPFVLVKENDVGSIRLILHNIDIQGN